MPITQQRMAEVITAGLDYQQALRRAARIVQQTINDHSATAEERFDRLGLLISEVGLLTAPTISPTVLALEDAHYRRNHSRNELNRHKMAQRRRDAGIPSRVIGPASLKTLSEVVGGATSESAKLETTLKESPEIAALRKQFPDMDPRAFAQIVKEAFSQAETPKYSAFDPPDESDDTGPLVSPNDTE